MGWADQFGDNGSPPKYDAAHQRPIAVRSSDGFTGGDNPRREQIFVNPDENSLVAAVLVFTHQHPPSLSLELVPRADREEKLLKEIQEKQLIVDGNPHSNISALTSAHLSELGIVAPKQAYPVIMTSVTQENQFSVAQDGRRIMRILESSDLLSCLASRRESLIDAIFSKFVSLDLRASDGNRGNAKR